MSSDTTVTRQSFLDYFRVNGHKIMPRSKIYIEDPTLFFVNAGMNQLKGVFLGTRETEPKYHQLMNSQICIRAGGKHSDFEDVGKDSYHLTCFEMLGNWSINKYGKESAIKLAYNYLVDVCKLNKDQMYVTYFEGDPKQGLDEDIETKRIWSQYFPENKIIKGNSKDNFWMMADNGPCGACTEIHYDLIGNREASAFVNTDDPTVVEIWNIVFIEHNKQEGVYKPLGKMFVDTGMGLERLSMILQKKSSIYQTDAFRYLFGYAQALTKSEFYTDCYDEKNKIDCAYRIFSDHIRTCVIALHEGVDFDYSKRGFILRKIFRRMMLNVYLYLNRMRIAPMMNKSLIKSVISDILNYFLEKSHDAEMIQKKLIEEEKLYIGHLRNVKRTCDNFRKKSQNIDEMIASLKQNHGIDAEIVLHVDEIKIDAREYS